MKRLTRSQTISAATENYVKAIALNGERGRIVSIGKLASAVGVTPGTATTMAKALSDAGYVHYEAYSGVRLTATGERLAARVLRRHRLIEAFLVKVVGMGWDEVHDEAEHLEHAVSDKLVNRIDELLGRPVIDPHGDPIPTADGSLRVRPTQTLLECPMRTSLKISRIADQTPAFLKFVESSRLMPGERVEVDARDTAADSVRLKLTGGQQLTIGTQAAAKLLVMLPALLWLVLASAAPLHAQSSGASSSPAPAPFGIADNSFLVEEAFNQEAGIFQNILNVVRTRDTGWTTTFTQEWPMGGQRHQLSYTVPWLDVDGMHGAGDVLINYRLQVWTERPGRPAFSPRVSLILPTGNEDKGLGTGSTGWQVNLPFSRQVRDVYFHWNAGFTHVPGALSRDRDIFTPQLAGSAIWRARPMVHLMLETVAAFPSVDRGSQQPIGRDALTTVSPGLRGGWNIGDKQVVLGVAVPVTFGGPRVDRGIFAYASYELPFRGRDAQ